MTLGGVALVATLLWADPVGDAHGAGDLSPPTAEVFSSSAPFDLTEVAVLDGDVLSLRVGLAERSNPGGLPNGITLAVIDLYLDTGEGGERELLPGPGLRMPDGRGWNLAVRVTGDRAFAIRSADRSVQHAVTVRTSEDALIIATPFAALAEAPIVHAMTGVYDPFGSEAWRPLTQSPSPWAFSAEGAASPVVDLLAEDDAAQREALRSGVLPERRAEPGSGPWLALMIGGLALAMAGVALRTFAGRRRAAPAEPAPADRSWTPVEVPDAGDVTGDLADDAGHEDAAAEADAEPDAEAAAEAPAVAPAEAAPDPALVSPDPTSVAVETEPTDPAPPAAGSAAAGRAPQTDAGGGDPDERPERVAERTQSEGEAADDVLTELLDDDLFEVPAAASDGDGDGQGDRDGDADRDDGSDGGARPEPRRRMALSEPEGEEDG